MATDSERLASARAAYEKLVSGQSTVAVQDSNGVRAEYNQGSITALAKLIRELEVTTGARTVSRPMRIFF